MAEMIQIVLSDEAQALLEKIKKNNAAGDVPVEERVGDIEKLLIGLSSGKFAYGLIDFDD